ncbi:MAG: hypothetical protein ACK53Y_25720, partial [bacterium]
ALLLPAADGALETRWLVVQGRGHMGLVRNSQGTVQRNRRLDCLDLQGIQRQRSRTGIGFWKRARGVAALETRSQPDSLRHSRRDRHARLQCGRDELQREN